MACLACVKSVPRGSPCNLKCQPTHLTTRRESPSGSSKIENTAFISQHPYGRPLKDMLNHRGMLTMEGVIYVFQSVAPFALRGGILSP